jgi:predicted acyltransferase
MELSKKRLLSLDLLRGITIIFMIIVNDPGSWDHVYAPLLHAEWNGITPTDYIFPTFLFVLGTSIVLSINKQRERGIDNNKILRKVLWRSAKIYLVGLFLWVWGKFFHQFSITFDEIRWVGVLQRISIVFLICSIIYMYTSLKTQIYICLLTLVGYLIVMCYVPIPGIGLPDLSVPEKNWTHYIDSLFLPGVMWQKTWDPEGILSTLPSIVTGIFGMFAGYIITKASELKEKIIYLFLLGFCLLIAGDISSYVFPFNKNLWSTSYTLLVGGISSLAFAFFVYFIDLNNNGRYFKFAKVFGVNSIFSYVLAGILTLLFYDDSLWGFGFNELFVENISSLGISKKLLSFIYALLYVLIIWIPTNYLYRKKIYIKL